MFHVKQFGVITIRASPHQALILSLAIVCMLGRRAVVEARLCRNKCDPKTARPASFDPVRSAWEALAFGELLHPLLKAPFEVLVQHEPVVVPAGEPLDGTSPDSGSVTRHRRRRSSPHFERLRKQFPVERTGRRISQVWRVWINSHDYFYQEVDRGAFKAADLPDGNAAVRGSTSSP
jgi:hypothetical protein